MKQMWKYNLTVGELNTISVPQNSELKTIQLQNGFPCVWLEVETKNDRCERMYKFFPTGVDIDEPAHYKGTIQLGWTVWHLYEVFK